MGQNAAKSNREEEEMEFLSLKYNINSQRLNLLRKRYTMLCSVNGKIFKRNYFIIYREFVNPNQSNREIDNSFNKFDTDKDNFLNFEVSFKFEF